MYRANRKQIYPQLVEKCVKCQLLSRKTRKIWFIEKYTIFLRKYKEWSLLLCLHMLVSDKLSCKLKRSNVETRRLPYFDCTLFAIMIVFSTCHQQHLNDHCLHLPPYLLLPSDEQQDTAASLTDAQHMHKEISELHTQLNNVSK